MKIGFIGAGKAGTAYGSYLKQKDFDVLGYYSRTYQSAHIASEYVGCTAFNDLPMLLEKCDTIFITTGDDQIADVVGSLVMILNAGNTTSNTTADARKSFIHMSGVYSSQILAPLAQIGFNTFCMHPLQAFSNIDTSVKQLSSTVFGIEEGRIVQGDKSGDKLNTYIIEEILKKTGNKYFILSAEQKSLYHAATCSISNYMVTLMDYGLSLFEEIGLDAKEAFDYIYPLMISTFENIKKEGTAKALTGPIARGDANTIRLHMNAIKETDADKAKFYALLGMQTLKVAEKLKLKDEKKIAEITTVLSEK